ncbi:hypothetical protein EDB86DRAFT_1848703 [Lactarius hatsudake]|nr:hypothetical protein EDB86DRAFT_1848703 [Lactarius hatsudake]
MPRLSTCHYFATCHLNHVLPRVGRSRYWCRLWSSSDFAGHTLKSCVNIIHVDLVETWNLNDKTRYLSSDEFKVKMSHLIKDLVGPTIMTSDPYPTGAGVEFADWVRDVYRGSQENVRCVMGYIVDLTVILDTIFNTTFGDISPERVLSVIDRHVSSGHRNRIHHDIQRFVAEAFAIGFSAQKKDLILDKVIDLIQEYCGPPPPPPKLIDSHLMISHVRMGDDMDTGNKYCGGW